MENYVVILLLSGVVLLGAFYGYTVEQKIVKIKIENVNEEIQYRNEMKNMEGKLESIKEHNDAFRTEMEDKYYAYRKDINEAKQGKRCTEYTIINDVKTLLSRQSYIA